MVDFVRKVCVAILEDKYVTQDILDNMSRVHQTSTNYCMIEDEDGDELVELEVDGLPYCHYEWGDGLECTGDEVRAYLEANPSLLEKVQEKRRQGMSRIAELNKEIAKLVNELTELCDECEMDVTIDLGQHGSLDPNSDWDSSRC